MSDTFDGFIPPTKNFFHMPNEWINICARITNLAELKVVQYVLRHTWGYREYDGKPKPITVDEFMNGRKKSDGSRIDDGTGLSKPSVIQGLKYAIKNGYLICEIDDVDKARVIKSYALKMSDASGVKDLNPQEENGGKGSLHQGSSIFTTGVNNLDINGKGSLPRSEKDTRERHSGKKEGTASQEIDSTQMGTPSLSSTPSLSQVDLSTKQPELSTNVEKTSLIANEDTGNVESKTTRNTSTQRNTEPLMPQPDPEANRVFNLLCEVFYAIPPDVITEKIRKQCIALAPFVRNAEDLKNLRDYARAEIMDDPSYKKKQVHLGNLVSFVNGWKQAQYKPATSPAKPLKQSSQLEDLKAIRARVLAEAQTGGR